MRNDLPQNIIPTVVESTMRGERAYDIYSLLLKERIIFLNTEVTPQSANLIVSQLLYLAHTSPGKEISLYISSPGGDIYSGMAVYDTMETISCDVATYSVGLTASMATILLCAGTKGKRYALPHSSILMHQPMMSGLQGQASDIDIHAREILRLRSRLNEILAEKSGQTIKKIAEDSDRDFWMDAKRAKEYGLIDEIVETRSSRDASKTAAKKTKKAAK